MPFDWGPLVLIIIYHLKVFLSQIENNINDFKIQDNRKNSYVVK